MLSGIEFQTVTPAVASDPNRADIALFVGFVAPRGDVLPSPLETWLRETGWLPEGDWRRGPYARRPQNVLRLSDVPVPVESWDEFVRLFRWDERPLFDGLPYDQRLRQRLVPTYLGAAVRAFFLQGGRRCYVVSVGEPWACTAGVAVRRAGLSRLVPGVPLAFTPRAVDRSSWSGAGHLFGLPDVSLLCLPDLPDAVATSPEWLRGDERGVGPPEDFVECGTDAENPGRDRGARLLGAPRADLDGYRAWRDVVRVLASGLGSDVRREVQLMIAAPLPAAGVRADRVGGAGAAADFHDFLEQAAVLPGADVRDDASCAASGFVQVAWPWLHTRLSARLPESIEPPDGTLAGIIARNALARGTYRTAAGQEPAGVQAFVPALRHSDAERALMKRVSVFGPTPSGPRLLSDVTTSAGLPCRQASVKRLVASIVRAARLLGEEITFEVAGDALRARVQQRVSDLMLGLLSAGALRGRDPAEAFQVRCDRTTVTQNDIDAGRLICHIGFVPANAVERITVVLALHGSGQAELDGAARMIVEPA